MGLDQRLAIFEEDDPDDADPNWCQHFRKVNFLHGWIERNILDGRETNCEDVPLNLEQIAGLTKDCEVVLAQPANAHVLLPVQQGFFFGHYEYDEYYLTDVKEVLTACQEILALCAVHHSHGGKPFKIEYWSWW